MLISQKKKKPILLCVCGTDTDRVQLFLWLVQGRQPSWFGTYINRLFEYAYNIIRVLWLVQGRQPAMFGMRCNR